MTLLIHRAAKAANKNWNADDTDYTDLGFLQLRKRILKIGEHPIYLRHPRSYLATISYEHKLAKFVRC